MDESGGSLIHSVEALPHRLYLVSLKRKDFTQASHALLEAFLSLEQREDAFFSFTETYEEISLILDRQTMQILDKYIELLGSKSPFLKYSKPFRAIHIGLGAEPYLSQGIVRQIVQPLAKEHVNLFYFTTFNTDYILVQESKFVKVKGILRNTFNDVWIDEEEDEQANQTSPNPERLLTFSEIPDVYELLSLPDMSLSLCSIPHKWSEIATDLIRIMFFPSSSNRFVSLTLMEGISLIIDQTSLSTFPKEKVTSVLEDSWIPIKRKKKHGFNETGVASAITEPLASIPLLYMSSYHSSYFMIQKPDFQRAVTALESKGFTIEKLKLDSSSAT